MMATPKIETAPPAGTEVLTASEAAAVRALVDEHGEAKAAAMLGVRAPTIVRALARVPIRPSNASCVRMGLERIGRGPAVG